MNEIKETILIKITNSHKCFSENTKKHIRTAVFNFLRNEGDVIGIDMDIRVEANV